MQEKRKSIRVKINSVVSYQVKNIRLTGGSRVKDISEIGIGFPSNHRFPIGSVLDLEIRSSELKGVIKVLARVVRVIKLTGSKYEFEVGLEFLDISLDQRKILHDYVQRTVGQEGSKDHVWLE